MTDQRWVPIRVLSCENCAGPVHRRTNVAAPDGMDDPTQPWLHLNEADWASDPHPATPAVCRHCGQALGQDANGFLVGDDLTSDCDGSPSGHELGGGV